MIKVKPALYSRVKRVCFGYSGVIEKLICNTLSRSLIPDRLRRMWITGGIYIPTAPLGH